MAQEERGCFSVEEHCYQANGTDKVSDLLRQITIDRSDDETMIDCYLREDYITEPFISNIKSLLMEEDWVILDKEINSSGEFEEFLSTESGQELLRTACRAAYCCWRGIVIDDNTRVCERTYTYYIHWNGIGVESQHECDIDLG